MNFVKNLRSSDWDNSYVNGDNHLFYPNETYVKIFSKYIAKKLINGQVKFNNNFSNKSKILDFGCGAGRHLKFISELGIYAIGADISTKALNLSKSRLSYLIKKSKIKLIKISDSNLEAIDNELDGVISCSVFDSMPHHVAKNYFKQLSIKLKKNGIFVFDLIDNILSDGNEIIINTKHENGTVQSYYNIEKINNLIDPSIEIIEKVTVKNYIESTNSIDIRNYIVGKKK